MPNNGLTRDCRTCIMDSRELEFMEDPPIIRCVLNHKRYVVKKEFITLNFITGCLEESDIYDEDGFGECEEYASYGREH